MYHSSNVLATQSSASRQELWIQQVTHFSILSPISTLPWILKALWQCKSTWGSKGIILITSSASCNWPAHRRRSTIHAGILLCKNCRNSVNWTPQIQRPWTDYIYGYSSSAFVPCPTFQRIPELWHYYVTILVSTLQGSSMLPHLAHISTYPRIMSLQEIELSDMILLNTLLASSSTLPHLMYISMRILLPM